MNLPVILFGAFDRHNLGDLLFPHVAAALLKDRRLVFAGVAERDLRPCGGHQVVALAQAGEGHLVHVGGEILTCEAWQTAVMVQTVEAASRVVAAYDADEVQRTAWAAQQLGVSRRAPYVAPKAGGALVFCGAGGVELERLSRDFRDEVLAVLRQADYLGVRDAVTLETLAAASIAAKLVPDPAVMVAELFGDRIRRQGEGGEPARIRAAFPQGYLAVQFSADFGDDATLAAIAAQLDRAAEDSGLGVVFFRAGAAPWHDDLEVLRAAAAPMAAPHKAVFESLHLWDLCALIAGSRGYCGSSLHGRIVAAAFALPGVNFLHPGRGGGLAKQEAYARTWGMGEAPVEVEGVAAALGRALAADRHGLEQTAASLCAAYRASFAQWGRWCGKSTTGKAGGR